MFLYRDAISKFSDWMRSFYRSFKHAFKGLVYAFRHERNFRVEVFCGMFIIALIFTLDLASWEQIVLMLMVVWVITVELINTVVERVVDMVRPRVHPYPRLIKDLMASVVLVSALLAVVAGSIIVLPHLFSWIHLFV